MGRRVSVRRVVGVGPQGRSQFADVVGDLVDLDAERALIEHRDGLVEVPVAQVAIARLVPPSSADELALEAVAARGWRARETAQLGGWLLRADGGFTGRANSVLPLKAVGMPLDDALERAAAWYGERGLPLRFSMPAEARRLLDAELGERGWAPSPDVLVMTARLDLLLAQHEAGGERDGGGDLDVDIAAAPDAAWFARYRDGAGASDVARALLTRHERAGFATIRGAGGVLAIGRGVVDDDWLGVAAVEVEPAARRQGLATRVMRALWAWGASHGATRSYLQVSSDNPAAVALYERLGYCEHHTYRYRDAPDSPRPDPLSGGQLC